MTNLTASPTNHLQWLLAASFPAARAPTGSQSPRTAAHPVAISIVDVKTEGPQNLMVIADSGRLLSALD